MRLRSVFILFMLGFFIAGSGIAVIYLLSSGQDSFNHQIEEYLVSVISVNGERISDFVGEMEMDVLFLVESKSTYDILRKDLVESEAAAKLDVGGRVKTIAKEIDNYLRAHPNMTLVDLQESKEFQLIAIQSVGKSGYSATLGKDDTVIYFHIDQEIIGSRLGVITDSVDLLEIIDQAKTTGFGEGFYDWVDVNGVLRKKYIEVKVVGVATADGVRMMSATTAYIDDYLVAGNVSDKLKNYFKKFSNLKDYHNVVIVSPNQRSVYMAMPMEGLGVEIFLSRIGLKEIGVKIDNLERGEVAFHGPFPGHMVSESLQIAVASKIYDGDIFLGSIIIIKEIDDVENILSEEESFRGKDEDYLVDKNGLLLTSLRTRDVDVLVQEMRTEAVEECVEDFEDAERRDMTVEEYEIFEKEEGLESALFPFQNFEGDLTYGLHRPIGKVEWCLLSEVSVEEVLNEPAEKSFKKQIVFRIWIFLLVIVLTVIGSLFIDKRYVLRKRKVRKYPCGHVGIMRPIVCRLTGAKCGTYSKGRCGKIAKGRGFFINLKMRYYLLFALVFAIAYFFIVISFFQGWQNAKLFDNVPDLLVMIVGIMIFVVGMKIRKINARGYVVWGGLLILLGRMSMILVNEYQSISAGSSLTLLWIPILVAEFLGFVLLLVGYGRLKNV